MTLFHVSVPDLGEKILLKARVPSAPMAGEDQVTPRVCFSTTLAGALRGKAGGEDLERAFCVFTNGVHFYDLVEEEIPNLAVYCPIAAIETHESTAPDAGMSEERVSFEDSLCGRIGYVDMESLAHGIVQLTDRKRSSIPGLMDILGYTEGAA